MSQYGVGGYGLGGYGWAAASEVITGTGALTTGVTTLAGAGKLTHTGTGDLNTGITTLDGAGAVANGPVGTGDLTTGAVALAGVGTVGHTGTGDLNVGTTTLNGSGTTPDASTGQGDGARNKKTSSKKKERKEDSYLVDKFGKEETSEEFIVRITKEITDKSIPKNILHKSENKALQNTESVVEYIKGLEHTLEKVKKVQLNIAIDKYLSKVNEEKFIRQQELLFIQQQELLLLWSI